MVWVFGYGSLVWKAGFPFKRKLVGYVEGFIRRFWWWSEDHRGVPGAPGRVVNLMVSADSTQRVWGVAYEVDDDLWRDQVQAQLDHREKGGYTRHQVLFHSPQEESKEVVLYIGVTTHRQFAGSAPLEEIARTIAVAEGPSGKNREYLYNLAEAMRSIDPDDGHLFELERVVRGMEVLEV